MSRKNPTEDEYYATLDDDLQSGAYDFVADLDEWRRFKKALLRWIDDQDAAWDRQAVSREHGGE